MAKLSADTKRRLNSVVNVGKTIFHWGFIPTVLYLGKDLVNHIVVIVPNFSMYPTMNFLSFSKNNVMTHFPCLILGFRKGTEPGMPPITIMR